MSNSNPKSTKVNSVLVFVTLLFGINPIVVKMGISALSPFVYTTGRLFVAVIAFGIVLKISGTWRQVDSKDIPIYLKMGVEAFIFQLGLITALEFVSAAVVATMIGLIPISVLVIHRVKGTRSISKHHFYGAACTFIGVLLVSNLMGGYTQDQGYSGLLGMLILLVAQFCAAMYMARSEVLLERYSHYQVSTLMFLVAFIIFLVLTVPELVVQGLPVVTGTTLAYVIYGGVVSLCIANNLWIWGIKKVGSHQAAVFNNLPPVFALIAGVLFLNEIPMPSQVIGVVVVLMGLYIFDGKLANASEI